MLRVDLYLRCLQSSPFGTIEAGEFQQKLNAFPLEIHSRQKERHREDEEKESERAKKHKRQAAEEASKRIRAQMDFEKD